MQIKGRIAVTVLFMDCMNAALSHHPVREGCQGKSTNEHSSALAEAIAGIRDIGSGTLGRAEQADSTSKNCEQNYEHRVALGFAINFQHNILLCERQHVNEVFGKGMSISYIVLHRETREA